MSLYNLINGVNPATFLLLPMLGKHYDEYPRFRDCFAGKMTNSQEYDDIGIPIKRLDTSEPVISIYTRVGGGNRDSYEKEITELQQMPGYLEDYDDDFDETYATFVFKIPEQYLEDYRKIMDGKFSEVSKEYQEVVLKTYPKVADKLAEAFSRENDVKSTKSDEAR